MRIKNLTNSISEAETKEFNTAISQSISHMASIHPEHYIEMIREFGHQKIVLYELENILAQTNNSKLKEFMANQNYYSVVWGTVLFFLSSLTSGLLHFAHQANKRYS
jgi:hypothetical protein